MTTHSLGEVTTQLLPLKWLGRSLKDQVPVNYSACRWQLPWVFSIKARNCESKATNTNSLQYNKLYCQGSLRRNGATLLVTVLRLNNGTRHLNACLPWLSYSPLAGYNEIASIFYEGIINFRRRRCRSSACVFRDSCIKMTNKWMHVRGWRLPSPPAT